VGEKGGAEILKGKVSFDVFGFKFDVEFESKEELQYIMTIVNAFLKLALTAKVEKKTEEQLRKEE
jgi:hypothetical protein